MNTQSVQAINEAIKHHTNYPSQGKTKKSSYYLDTMDVLALSYDGRTSSERLSNLLEEYYLEIGVKSFNEAIKYIVELDK